MTAKPTLRDRRRLQTSRDIQLAALKLAIDLGYDLLTTEMIANEAGISPRTFFNYYTNKDAAIVGTAPCFDQATMDWLRSSSGSLLDDLMQALGSLLSNGALDRRTTQLITALLEARPELSQMFYASLRELRDQIVETALARTEEIDRAQAELLADAVIHALGDAFRIWAGDDTLSEDCIIDITAEGLNTLCRMLS